VIVKPFASLVYLRLSLEPSSLIDAIPLVVLPFENIGPTDDEWFADGITDEITTRLVSLHELDVISNKIAIHYN
jgi:TolB-like protein